MSPDDPIKIGGPFIVSKSFEEHVVDQARRQSQEFQSAQNRAIEQSYVPPFLAKPGAFIPIDGDPRTFLAKPLPTVPAERKAMPLVTGCLDYFPLALLEVAKVSRAGNEQHNPGQPLHWDRSKSTDEADALGRHLLERGKFDTDGQRHTAKLAWRALALLQKELESDA